MDKIIYFTLYLLGVQIVGNGLITIANHKTQLVVFCVGLAVVALVAGFAAISSLLEE